VGVSTKKGTALARRWTATTLGVVMGTKIPIPHTTRLLLDGSHLLHTMPIHFWEVTRSCQRAAETRPEEFPQLDSTIENLPNA